MTYDLTQQYDAVGLLKHQTQAAGAGQTVDEHFCYDHQNRVSEAATSGHPGCTAAGYTLPTATLLNAGYGDQAYNYNTIDQQTTGPLGGTSAFDPNHIDGTTSVTGGTSSYATSFDAAGHMTARNGQALTYDNGGRQLTWTDASPSTNTSSYAYDGEGHRVAQSTTVSGTTTTTAYLLGGLQEVATTGGATTTTVYYQAVAATAIAVNGGALTYVISDTNGSIVRGIAANGTAAGMRLYTPYGVPTVNQPGIPTNHSYQGGYTDQAGLVSQGTTAHDTQAGQSTQVGGGAPQRNGGGGAASSGNGGNTGSGNGAPQSNPNVGGTNPVAQSTGATNSNTAAQTGGCVGCKAVTIDTNPEPNFTWNHNAVVNEFYEELLVLAGSLHSGRNPRDFVDKDFILPNASWTRNRGGGGNGRVDIVLWNDDAHTQGWIWDAKAAGQVSGGPAQISNYVTAAKAIGIDFHPGHFYIAGNILPYGAHVVVPPPYSPVTINPVTEELLAWKSPFDGIIAYDVFPKSNPPVYVLPVFAPSFNPWKQWQWNPWILNPRYQPDQSIGGIILAGLAAAAAAIAFGGGCVNRYQCYDMR